MDSLQMSPEEKKQLAANTQMTLEIHRAVVGDPKFGHVGLVGRVGKVEERSDRHEEQLRAVDGKISKVVYGLGGLMAAIKLYEAFAPHLTK